MKYVVCVPDGASDEPVPELGGLHPARGRRPCPTLAALAARGEVGRAATIPAGIPPGSDVGNMSILGYDPAVHHTGRAPIEAAAMGLKLGADQVAYRCNLVTVGAEGTMVDFAGGHPPPRRRPRWSRRCEAELGGGEIVVPRRRPVPPHPGRRRPTGPTPSAPRLTTSSASRRSGRPAPPAPKLQGADGRLPGGRRRVRTGRQPDLALGPGPPAPSCPPSRSPTAWRPAWSARSTWSGASACSPASAAAEVEGITGWYDTNYEGKRDACLQALADGHDLFVIHVEASDEAGHAGDVAEKVQALEDWDRRILRPLVEGLDDFRPWRLLLLPDHPTPLALRTHTSDAVPYMLVDSESGAGGVYTEAAPRRPRRCRAHPDEPARPPEGVTEGLHEARAMKILVLIDGEHYPPVVRATIETLPTRLPGADVVGGALLGGGEKLATTLADDLGLGLTVVRGDGCHAALAEGLRRFRPDVVFDLSDEPVVDARQRMGLAARSLVAGAAYQGADFRFDPPLRPRVATKPTIAIIGTRQAHGEDSPVGVAGPLLAERGTPPVVVAMGRGGPPEPELIDPATFDLTPAGLAALAASGRHAASDHLEDALMAGVVTVGTRRCGGGLAGAPFDSTFVAGVKLANGRSETLLVFEGSGSAVPPVHADVTICVVPATADPELVTGYLGAYRLLLS